MAGSGSSERGASRASNTRDGSRAPASLAKKLGIKSGSVIALLAAPPGFERLLDPLPDDVEIRTQARGRLDVIVFFATRERELARRFPGMARALQPDGGLWVAWPKKKSCVATDLTFDPVQQTGLDCGLVDNKVCAIDDAWSALRFVGRVADRPARR
ncbi:MAG: DUF3052 domain-containing protein [Acidimicrobiia bacterium]